ncbi:replicative DNA helicase [Gephyromycinifex aptenodytis]|uniref:replicative DNA helicase n=1 Tax=Gephyromycinifex aptenodytis TaxID=2716227 RepID=UPI001446B486|nr:replicative DNA helicase [Gephyromycinifex aptenodytis]
MSLARVDRSDFEGPLQSVSEAVDDRLPPQDVNAEQSVLGGMMLSKDAIADCIEVLRGVDFYRPAHELVYDAILDLYGRGEPADAITVADELTKRGDLTRVGGQSYLHQLISAVPTAANAGYYAQIVAERAVLRRLVDAGTRIVQMGYGTGGGDVEEIVNAAQAEVYAVADKRGGEDYHLLGELLEATADEIEQASGATGEMVGVPTGFTDLDELTNGLHGGQMVVIAARPAMGKALALDTPLPTPTGWTTMGQVQVGDEVLGADGRAIAVVAATPVMTGRPCYEVGFSDGSRIIADEQHLWLTQARAEAGSLGALAVRTTADIAASLRAGDGQPNHSVSLSAALDLDDVELPVGPYTLGAWLGDGDASSATITSVEPEVLAGIRAEGYAATPLGGAAQYALGLGSRPASPDAEVGTATSARQLVSVGAPAGAATPTSGADRPSAEPSVGREPDAVGAALRGLGVLPDKHIPATYLRAAQPARRALLAGLADTAGTLTTSGSAQFTTTSPRLAADLHELIVGLGCACSVAEQPVRSQDAQSATAYTLSFTSAEPVFTVQRKAGAHAAHAGRGQGAGRFITSVRPVASVPVRCIQVAARDHLYLAGRAMIPTHNSTLALDIARAAAIKHGQTAVVFSLEMSRSEITMRLLSAEAGIQLQHMRKGTMRDEDWSKLARTMGEVSEAPLFIDDSPNMSLMEIRAKCRRLKQKHGLRLVIIDYLQLMSSGKRVESRQQEVSEFSRALKLLAKELEVPVVALSQLNRGPEQRTDKKPQISDLRESGCLVAETRILRADTGAETTIGELVASGEKDVPVWALDESLRYVTRPMTHAFSTGVKPVYRLRLASGKTVRATENHPFLGYDGWVRLGELLCGDRVAVPRHVGAPAHVDESWADEDVRTAALLCGEHPAATFPAALFALPKRQIALFIREVMTLVGGVMLSSDRPGGEIFCFAADRRRLDKLSLLLLRFGVSCVVTGDDEQGWMLDIVDVDSQRRFLQEIGIGGPAAPDAARLLTIVRDVTAAPQPGPGQLPLWQDVASVIAPEPEPDSETSAGTLRQVAAVLEREDVDLAAVNDVEWEVVVGVEYDGEEEVFDATVLGTHNFIANGIAVHNSIEQDADLVMLLHRESVYEQDSPREGEADIIVAKHRNGPTKTITVAFQGHYSRFMNMAASY